MAPRAERPPGALGSGRAGGLVGPMRMRTLAMRLAGFMALACLLVSRSSTSTSSSDLSGAPSAPSAPSGPSGTSSTSSSTSDTTSTSSPLTEEAAGTEFQRRRLKFEFQRYDGWYNNLANSDWGTPESRLRRKVAPAYSDGVYQMADEGRPSARVLSQRMMRGEDGLASARNLTTIFAFFGQLISSEILMASESGCPIEMVRIKIERCDPMYDRECRGGRSMPFYRSAYDPATGQSPNLPREQVNRVTSWLDGSFVYSTSETWLNTMRSFDGRGTLRMAAGPGAGSSSELNSNPGAAEPEEARPPPPALLGYPVRNRQRAPLINQMPAHHLKMKRAERMFLLGDPRTNQNPIILAFGILFYRWHNVLAERIHAQHPQWSDEEIFQRARRLVIASLQNIVLYEYLPTLLDTPAPAPGAPPPPEEEAADSVRPYAGYKPDLHPGVSHVFQSAAFRFGHTMIPPGLYLRDDKCRFLGTPAGHRGLRLCSTWWNAEEVVSRAGIEQLLMGAASQLAEREDYVLCNDVRDKLFGPLDFSRRDLAALNIMRGRDNGLPDYNTVRAAFQLPRVQHWREINPVLHARQPQLFQELAQLYQHQLDKLDLYVGGMLESDFERGRPGPLFRRIIKEQFERLRDADRFWFENLESGLFSKAEIEEIRSIKLYDLIVNATLIPERAIQRSVFQFRAQDPCPQPSQLSSRQLQPCYVVKGHSYFKGSELTYLLVCLALLLVPLLCHLAAQLAVRRQDRKRRQFKTRQEYQRNQAAASEAPAADKAADKFYAKEWLHPALKRKIKVRFGPAPDHTIYILDRRCQVQRRLELQQASHLVVELSAEQDHGRTSLPVPVAPSPPAAAAAAAAADQTQNWTAADLDQPVRHKPMLLLRAPRNYDLVLQFCDVQQRRKFVAKLEAYLRSVDKSMSLFRVPRELMLANAETKERRQQRLEQFFREAYALTFGLGQANGAQKVSPDIGLVMRTSLSKQEFAEALGMRADSLFVKQMFNCVDKDGNGRISFQEFLDTVVMFSRGKPDDKLRIIFDMCDHGARGLIDKRELVRVLGSLVDMAKTKSLSESGTAQMIQEMFRAHGLEEKPMLSYDDFKLIVGGAAAPAHPGAFNNMGHQILTIGLDMKGAKKNFLLDTGGREGAREARKPAGLAHRLLDRWRWLITELEEHRQDIVYLLMFYVIVAVLFFERFVMYSFLSEHMDLRHVMGFGIAITRGSAASLSFCYAMLLLSMCRNLMTWIRTMGVREYIPLDSHVKFHKIVAMTALLMTLLHTAGHCINFYHVTQQPVEHLRCLTKEMQFSGEHRPTFFYWIFQTVTGTTGLALWILCSLIYVFAQQQVRQRAYNFFWSTHKLYYLLYALTLLHGSSKLTGSPRFWTFFMVPAILFTIDKIMSLQTKLHQLEIYETECLPSDVISIRFARPHSFKFLSGQWVRVACTAFRPHQFHAFTLTSAPQDDFLSVHVRAQGPWTWKLRSLFDPANLQYSKAPGASLPPRIRIEGPFGGGNQDWYKYEVAVMIGGGIGVTPYASILSDLVYGTSTSRHSRTAHKKVYFIWICPSHRNFEWFIDVLREVEQRDVTNVLEMHIFITQFFHKFDLRTTMLYICENHFQRISNRSLFTGLKAVNHFGRPDLAALLQHVQNQHSRVNKVGVFSCGPKALTKSVTEACEKVNKRRKLPFFLHQYENFS